MSNADLTSPGPNAPLSPETRDYSDLPQRQAFILLGSVLIVAMCGIVYELIIGTVSSYLIGDSVYQFSLTIGFFMFAMGIGSYVSRFIRGNLIQAFIQIELMLAILGGMCSISLFLLFPFAPWLYQVGMFGFILTIGFLVGLEIPVLTRVLSQRSSMRESIADVLSLDYVGALFGAVAFPLLLLPSLGLITASFAVGLTNALVALLNVFWLRDYLDDFRRMLSYVVLTVVALFVLTLAASRITGWAQHHLYFDRIVWQTQSPYQSLVVTNTWDHGDVRLFIDGHLQFAEVDEYRYHEFLVHPVMSWGDSAPANVLILGGGDGLAVREVLRHDGIERIDLVDLDPEMTRLGTEFAPVTRLNGDSLASSKVHIHNLDAFRFVQETEHSYDRIIIDFPDPHNEALSKLYSVEFYAMVQAIMAPDATLVTQSSSPFATTNTYWTVAHTLDQIFPQITSYQTSVPSFGIWGFHMASRDDLAALGTLPDGLRALTPQAFTAATIFPADLLPTKALEVNSIFEPTIYQRYAEDRKRL